MTRYVVRMAMADGVPHDLLVTRPCGLARGASRQGGHVARRASQVQPQVLGGEGRGWPVNVHYCDRCGKEMTGPPAETRFVALDNDPVLRADGVLFARWLATP